MEDVVTSNIKIPISSTVPHEQTLCNDVEYFSCPGNIVSGVDNFVRHRLYFYKPVMSSMYHNPFIS